MDTLFGYKGSAKLHISTVHKKLKEHKCEECDKSFGQRGSLDTHVNTVHKNLRPFKCQICFKIDSLLFSRRLAFVSKITKLHFYVKLQFAFLSWDFEIIGPRTLGPGTRFWETCFKRTRIENSLRFRTPFIRKLALRITFFRTCFWELAFENLLSRTRFRELAFKNSL
jgi:hypothetical protein